MQIGEEKLKPKEVAYFITKSLLPWNKNSWREAVNDNHVENELIGSSLIIHLVKEMDSGANSTLKAHSWGEIYPR